MDYLPAQGDKWGLIYVNNVALHATLNDEGQIRGHFFVDSEQHRHVRCSQHWLPDALRVGLAVYTSGNWYSLRFMENYPPRSLK